MRPRFLLLIFAGVIAAVSTFGVLNLRRASLARTARAMLERERTSVSAAILRHEARTTEAERERATFEAAIVAAAQPSMPAAAPAKAEKYTTVSETLEKDVRAQIAKLTHERAHVAATYGALFRNLGLSPEQIGKFQEIALKRKERIMDLQAIMGNKGLTWQDPAIKKLQQENEAEFVAAQKALLGDDGYSKFDRYERTSWLREMMVGWAGGAAVVARDPFTFEQGERLVEIMANASPNYRNGFHA